MDTIPPPERVARARRLYAEGVKAAAIRAETLMTQVQLKRCLAGEYDDGSGDKPLPIPLRSASKRKPVRDTDRGALIEKLWRAAEKQVDEIEARLAAAGLEISEREGNARTFAIVVKTLRELKALDERKQAHGRNVATSGEGERFPRSVDELRRSLARKIEGILAERTGEAPDPG